MITYRLDSIYNASQKHVSTLLYTYVLKKFDSQPFMYNKVQIGQLFEAHGVFEKCLKTVKLLFSK